MHGSGGLDEAKEATYMTVVAEVKALRASQSFETFRDLVEHSMETGVDLNYFATIVWMIWHRRNALRTIAKPFLVQQVRHEAQSTQATFVCSIPPKPLDQGKGDPQQISVISTVAENFSLPFFINAVEVIAAKKALKFALELDLSAIFLEGNSKNTIDALLSEEVSLADIGHLIEEAKLYGDQLEEVEFNHVKRQGKKEVHNIANMQDMLASSRCGWRMFLHTSLV
ncbi:hypothetical protein SO802_006746 [Lithocarpus litseifolius]|uniref:RNase H type-1 domain-containing protein n=1 Tax=Lithocarpus litseifolius TaxID=425828 RepID=A0AAW2DPX4_9ROSI